MTTEENYEREKQAALRLREARQRIGAELAKVIVGQTEVIDHLLIAVLSGGHCLITGAPGLAKTTLVKALANVFDLKFQRIQFTPDLMPADITGTEILQETEQGRRMTFVRGPIFANVILADEINRTPPKTQAALLEAMQEHHVTAAGVTHPLGRPFFVLATQNPIEMEGTYPLPEAQLDRFMFNVNIDYLPEDEEVAVVLQTTAREPETLRALYNGEDLLAFQAVVRKVPIAEEVARYAVRLASASRPRRTGAPRFVEDWVRWGAGLRAGQFLVLGAKTRALLDGRAHVRPEDVRAVALPVMRHRLLLNYRAEADGVTAEGLIGRLLEAVPGILSAMSPETSLPIKGLVDTAALMKIGSLELRARMVMEGFQRGLHRSPFHGFSVEFSEYRPYVPGDDVRFLDWRLYARSDRDYVKKFEDETNLRCHLVVDQSGSMEYGSLGWRKADYAATLAATLAHFLHAQGDAVGLVTFTDRVTEHLPPRHRPGQLRQVLIGLERAPQGPTGELAKPLAAVAGLLARRGLLVLISDLLAPAGELERQLGALAASGQEVVIFQVLDPAERSFTFEEGGPSVFRDLESGRQLFIDPSAARAGYQQALGAHLEMIAGACRRWGVHHQLLQTDHALDLALLGFLAGRRRGRDGRAA